jgi:hypothetical protein
MYSDIANENVSLVMRVTYRRKEYITCIVPLHTQASRVYSDEAMLEYWIQLRYVVVRVERAMLESFRVQLRFESGSNVSRNQYQLHHNALPSGTRSQRVPCTTR